MRSRSGAPSHALYHVPVTRTHHRSTARTSARSRRALFVSRGSDQRDLVLGFSGIRNTDRLERHESRRRTMAHVADHLSFETLADLEHVVTERCRVLNGDQLKPGTNFHWWPKPDIPA